MSIKKISIVLLLCSYIGYSQATSPYSECSYEEDVTSESLSTSLHATAEARPLIPALTYDTTFKWVFKDEEFLKSFLNGIYGYNKNCYIEKIKYLDDNVSTTILKRGKVTADIRCACFLNTREKDESISFILEMQRQRQDSYVDRVNLESSTVISDKYTESVNDIELLPSKRAPKTEIIKRRSSSKSKSIKRSSSPKMGQDEKLKKNVPTVRHLSILLEDYNSEYGAIFHVAPMVMNGELYLGNVRATTITLPTGKHIIATDRQLHTFIQIKQCQKLIESKKEFADWLKLLSMELLVDSKTDEMLYDYVKLYEAPSVRNEVVNKAIVFLQNKIKTKEELLKLSKEIEAIQKAKNLKEEKRLAEEEAKRAKEEAVRAEEKAVRAEEKADTEAKARKLAEERAEKAEEEVAKLRAILEEFNLTQKRKPN